MLRVDDYMAYYRAAKQRFTETVLGTDVAPAPAAAYPPRPPIPSRSSIAACADGRSCARFAAATTTISRWSPASPRGSGRRSSRASSTPSCDWPRRRSRSIRRSTARAPRASSACASRPASRSRAGACRSRSTSCSLPDRCRARAGHPAGAGSRRPVPRPRGRPVRVRRRRRLPVRGHGRAGRVPGVLVLRSGRVGRRHAGRREAGVRAAHGLPHRSARSDTRRCTSTTTRRTSRPP